MNDTKKSTEQLYKSMIDYCIRVSKSALGTDNYDSSLSQQVYSLPIMVEMVLQHEESYQSEDILKLHQAITELCMYAMSDEEVHPQLTCTLTNLLRIILRIEKDSSENQTAASGN